MKLSHWFYKQILDHLGEAVYFVDLQRRILYWNRVAERMTGYKAEDVVGRCCYDNILQHVDAQMSPLCEGRCPLTHAIETGHPVEERVFLCHQDGHRLPVDVKVAPVRDRQGRIVGAVEVFTDASAFVQVEQLNQDLQRLANIDALTQLPNRRAILNALEREMERFRRYRTLFSVAFADLDHFKTVNDTFGHTVGDHTLTWIAGQLRNCLRRVDLVGRFGGEEFVIVLPATRGEAAATVAEHLRREIAGMLCPATGSPISLSFGVAGVRPSDTVESLLERADAAMYESKRHGRNRVTLTPDHDGDDASYEHCRT